MQGIKKKLVAALTVVALVVSALATALPAYAADENASLVVKGSEQLNGKEIYALKMFDLTKSGDNAIAYTLDEDWEGFFKSAEKYGCQDLEGETLSRKAYEYVAKLTGDDQNDTTTQLSTFASEAADYVLDNPSTFSTDRKIATGAETSPDSGEYQAKFIGLDYGYYLVYPLGSTGNGTRDTYAMLYNVDETSVEISMKSEYPTVDKEIVEGDGTVSGNTAQIGDTLTFTLTAKVPDVSAYDEYYKFAFVDTLSKGLKFNSITSVQWAESENGLFSDMDGTNYTVTPPNYTGTDSSELRIDFGTKTQAGEPATEIYDALTLFQGHKGWTIKVTYTVTLTEAAVVVDDANTNSAKVEFTTDPDSTGTGSSTEDITKTYTFGFGINKQKGGADGAADGALADAVFKIYKDDGTEAGKWDSSDTVVKFTKRENANKVGFDYYTVDMTSGSETLTTTLNKLYVCGLDEGTYWIEEVSAPDGYNKMGGYIKVEISSTIDGNGNLTGHTIKFTDTDGSEISGADHSNDHTIQIINKTGSLLPETGGMGTVIFTVVGVAVVAGGAIWMVQRNRRNAASNGSHMA
ncbi:SpaH/EbpB family LPXTG-anchored major pilin [Collinsella ihumii]|uniref:SpaH/EbpB family LPXTG-anchored major pilin n=1 Tax=Collinsella ihumii TaxID=1720204 RepID=UPI0025AAA74C|nr:SpaH/EbpB family LPXTG-anchored major pilin [Collinsella ihumii]MDN0055810.1 SpaH/EbpB family LPXTG-anchored major pilin [Collinsella ihumii]